VNLEFDGTRVLVGGASRGIGLAIAEGFLGEGAEVVISGRTAATLAETRARLSERFPERRVVALQADLRDSGEVERAVGTAVSELGGLDVVVANAGSGRGPTGNAVGAERWKEMLDENLHTAVLLCEAALGVLGKGGAIAVIGSIAGMEFHRAPLPYGAAKAALLRYTRDLARRLGPEGVRVNMVAPGNIVFPGGDWERRLEADREATEAFIREEVPMGRFGTPEEIAAATLFLCSPRSSFTTGSCLVADGGQLRA
jgi:3-oxoacyl-[acyl-carrier protein] reductase